MIFAFTGKTGSGKTFRMVKFAYKRWLKGDDIYSNTILTFKTSRNLRDFIRSITSVFVRRQHKGLKRGRIIYFEDIEEILEAKNGLILFDEAQVLFNARSWEALPTEFQYKLQQHRKHRLDLYCTTQSMGTIDITYRRLVQKWWHCESTFLRIGGHLTWLGLYRVKEKDVDMIYESDREVNIDTTGTRYFWIHFMKKKLYDTFYDIGFKRFKTLWITEYDPTEVKFKNKCMIIPKNLTMKQADTAINSIKKTLNPTYGKKKQTSYQKY